MRPCGLGNDESADEILRFPSSDRILVVGDRGRAVNIAEEKRDLCISRLKPNFKELFFFSQTTLSREASLPTANAHQYPTPSGHQVGPSHFVLLVVIAANAPTSTISNKLCHDDCPGEQNPRSSSEHTLCMASVSSRSATPLATSDHQPNFFPTHFTSHMLSHQANCSPFGNVISHALCFPTGSATWGGAGGCVSLMHSTARMKQKRKKTGGYRFIIVLLSLRLNHTHTTRVSSISFSPFPFDFPFQSMSTDFILIPCPARSRKKRKKVSTV